MEVNLKVKDTGELIENAIIINGVVNIPVFGHECKQCSLRPICRKTYPSCGIFGNYNNTIFKEVEVCY